MANLSREQALQRIKEPKNAREITRAQQKRIRHRLHTEPDTEAGLFFLSDSHDRFLSWVRSLLKNEENYSRFRSLYRPPVPTNELAESIFSEFEKVFEAENSFEKFEFTDDELENDAADYRKRIGDLSFWETQGFETFKNSIDNILVIDLPKLQTDVNGEVISTSNRPEPYYYMLDIDNVVDIDNSKTIGTDSSGKEFYYFKTEYLIFQGPNIDEGRLIYVFDDTFYRWFVKDDKGEVKFIGETAHNLNFCPARSFWTTPLNSSCTIQKRGPLTNSISELDWLLFFSIAQKYLELYAPFPIYAMYKSKCTHKVKETGEVCIDGFLEIPGQRSLEKRKCPNCSNRFHIGPGHMILIDRPKDKSDDPDLMSNPMKVIPAERDSLDYVQGAIKAKRDEIFMNCVGRYQDPLNKQAMNTDQIASGFESSESVLFKVKRNFEIAHHFAIDTVFRLRYGAAYLRATINYGDKFFAKDESQEIADYEQAAKTGMPEYELEMRRQQIDDVRYKNDPDARERLRILKNLEPFNGISVDKLIEMRSKNPEFISPKDVVIKLQFNSFIDRFEREQSNLLIFARALDFDQKIKLISDELGKFATEYLEKAKELVPPPDPTPAPLPAV